jgi:hypothetical protein
MSKAKGTKTQITEKPDEVDLRDNLIWSLSKECRDEIIWIFQVAPHNVSVKRPDPAVLDQKARRILIRSIFAFIEAVSFAIKSEALRQEEKILLTREEVNIAREESFELDDQGQIRKTKAKLRTLPNLRFAFRLYSKLGGYEYELDCKCQGWQQLTESLKVRDRLMHPKSLKDLTISASEIRSAFSAHDWFEGQVISLINKQNEKMKAELNQVRKQFAHLLPTKS